MADEKTTTQPPQYEWIPPRDGRPIPEIYTNYIITSWTTFDVRARFGQLVPTTSGPGKGNFVVEERAAVTISWQHLKTVSKLLAKLVADYERTNGEIPVLKLPEETPL
jgi:Protein of unknown function (DUF3467)